MPEDAVLVTGASSGIGLETALCLAQNGYRVFASMRNLDRRIALDAEAARRGVKVEILKLDNTIPETINETLEVIRGRAGGLYGLVNNAGSIIRGYFEDVSESEARQVFEANVFGTMAVTRAVLPLMREAGRGRIVLITSIGGRLGSPGNAVYCASKFALEGFGESLNQEVGSFGINVSLVEPGVVRTELFGRNRNTAAGALEPSSPYAKWFQNLEVLTDREVQAAVTSAGQVAGAVLRALKAPTPRLRYVVGRRASLLLRLRRYLPGETFDRIWTRELTRRISSIS